MKKKTCSTCIDAPTCLMKIDYTGNCPSYVSKDSENKEDTNDHYDRHSYRLHIGKCRYKD